MRYLLSTLILYATVTLPAWAVTMPPSNTIPEPETLALLGVGILALLIGRKKKK